jgi:hypothetical protein
MKKWGRGKLITNKLIYEGEFVNDKIEGKGRIKFLKSGIEYEGTFINDNIEGYGKFKWINGDIYEGEVKNNKMHGNGVYHYKNGKVFKGLFKNGQISKTENSNVKNSLISERLNYQYDTEKFDYINPFRKIESLKIDNPEIINNYKPKNYQFKTHKSTAKTFANHEEDKFEKEISNNMYNINEFKQNKDVNIHDNNKYALNNVTKINKFNNDRNNPNKISSSNKGNVVNKKLNNKKDESKAENPELLLSTYRNYGFRDEIKNNVY